MSTYMSHCMYLHDTIHVDTYILSLHDALPIWDRVHALPDVSRRGAGARFADDARARPHDADGRQHAPGWGQSRVARRRSRSEEHTSELQSHSDLVCRLLLEKKKIQ